MQWNYEQALTAEGWRRDVAVSIDAAGLITNVAPDSPGVGTPVKGAAVPGVANAHSHAFQRALVGLTEHRGAERDSFWTWREAMYRLAATITPEDLNAIAVQLYVEMLKGGYTAVCEFHYLHQAPIGGRAMGQAVIDAAARTGIDLTLLPTLYMTSDFGGAAPNEGQKRFVHSVEDFLRLRGDLQADGVVMGTAIHSLRAVPPAALAQLLAGLEGDSPIHIHIAEQRKEVERCLEVTGARPVEWLLANAAVDSRWNLVHATHVVETEMAGIRAAGATVVLCPTTEANLGDGVFPAEAHLSASGSISIGSDSHVSVNLAEELRLLEYGQRLITGERNVLSSVGEPHTGVRLHKAAAAGGARSSGRATGVIAPGTRADIVVLDTDAAALFGREGDNVLDAWVFGGFADPVKDVMVGGVWRIIGGRHGREDEIADAYRAAISRLKSV
ncbi:formimidoylglutamate deiminase [Caulobacter sp. NIBR2454]|uniref:formimidoylglutamate deiminase n=1 Tax=Caulobacter sp. NIBR2454 TaxID=3015996 RepID=UPI0022B6BB64|nr:formimidoylglutamate deiminase [Caulobacter sp. NIBR2454]